jgi:hypothetical protein
MLRSTALLLVAVLASVAASAAERPACELLTLEEVGRAAGAAVAIDKSASGEDDRGGDNCVWKAGSQVVAEMRIQRLASAPEGRRAFSDARTEAFGARRRRRRSPAWATRRSTVTSSEPRAGR